jgi:hypothetical protein
MDYKLDLSLLNTTSIRDAEFHSSFPNLIFLANYAYAGFHTVGGGGGIYPWHEFDMGVSTINLSFLEKHFLVLKI